MSTRRTDRPNATGRRRRAWLGPRPFSLFPPSPVSAVAEKGRRGSRGWVAAASNRADRELGSRSGCRVRRLFLGRGAPSRPGRSGLKWASRPRVRRFGDQALPFLLLQPSVPVTRLRVGCRTVACFCSMLFYPCPWVTGEAGTLPTSP